MASPATVAWTALNGVLTAPAGFGEAVYPYWTIPVEPISVHEFDNRLFGKVWNYKEIDHISNEQLFAESKTYQLSIENKASLLPHLLSGLDVTFASRVKPGNIIVAGEDFGCGKLIKHAVVGLAAAGIKMIIVRSVNRRFFRMAAEHGLLILIAPALVSKYRSGDDLIVDLEDKRIYLNQEEYNLPEIDPQFVEILRRKS